MSFSTSEQIDQISMDLSRAQGEIKNPPFDSINPHFKNKFASLPVTFEEVRPVFSKYGLSFIQAVSTTEKGNFLITRLMHKSGQWMQSEMLLILPKQDMQGLGSATTYAKRYQICAFAGVAGDQDDDGNQAVKPKVEEKPKPKEIHKESDPKKENKFLSEAQVKRLFALANNAAWKNSQVKEFMKVAFKLESTKDLTWVQYESLCKILEKKNGFDQAIFDHQPGPPNQ